MTSQVSRDPHPHDHVAPYDAPASDVGNHAGHGAHRWMMIACCIPMLVIVGVLVATGVAGAGAILYAVVCLAMMALMMRLMPGSHR
jgi:hypothetical protein